MVPACNAANTIAGCLRALLDLRFDEPYEVIVVDDGSTDDTARIAESFVPFVHVMRQPHRGAAAARNAGVQIAKGNIVLFTDADCEPVGEWAGALVAAIEAGADGAKGIYRTRQRSIIARFVQAEYESKYRRMEGRASIDFIDTYSAAYRRQVLAEAGGFNEHLPVDEDQELSFRLAEAGKRLVFVPEAAVYHKHVSSPADYVRRKFRIGYWKVFVGAMHPERMVSDSHTPQGMKIEMLLVGASLASLAATPFSRLARRAGATFGLGFFLATIPFASRVAFREPAVAIIAPFMLLLRALGLGFGLLAGILRLAISHSYNTDGFSSTIIAMSNPESENSPTPSPSMSGVPSGPRTIVLGLGEEKPADEEPADTASGVTEDEPLLGAYESSSEPEPSTPIFVEVITEEPVEYLAPERPVSTGDLMPEPRRPSSSASSSAGSPTPEGEPLGAGVDTMPYPIISDEPDIQGSPSFALRQGDEDFIPDPITEETEDSYPIPRPFGTTAPLVPKPGQKVTDPETDSDSGD